MHACQEKRRTACSCFACARRCQSPADGGGGGGCQGGVGSGIGSGLLPPRDAAAGAVRGKQHRQACDGRPAWSAGRSRRSTGCPLLEGCPARPHCNATQPCGVHAQPCWHEAQRAVLTHAGKDGTVLGHKSPPVVVSSVVQLVICIVKQAAQQSLCLRLQSRQLLQPRCLRTALAGVLAHCCSCMQSQLVQSQLPASGSGPQVGCWAAVLGRCRAVCVA